MTIKDICALQLVRISRGMTQKELAEKSGVKLRTIRDYERRATNIDRARLDILCALAEVLDCSVCAILEDAELADRAVKQFW